MTHVNRREMLALAAGAGLAGALPAFGVEAQEKEVVIGGSIPLTGVFAFAGVGIEAGMSDFVKIANDAGGIAGRKLRLAYEDTAYKVDQSVAVFNKLTAQNDIHLYYGDSTGFAKTINEELNRRGTILMAGASFGSELNNPQKYPFQFMAGPDYVEMIAILLEYIAKQQKGAKIVFVNSDTEFGRDPIEASVKRAKEMGMEVVGQIVTPPSAVDVSTEVLKLRRWNPDYAIFQGYVLAPLPEFLTQAKQLGLKTKFMGTFWSMDNSLWANVGAPADGYMGVMPYRYYYDTAPDAPMLEKIRKLRPTYQSTGYIQGFLTAMLFTEAAKRVLEKGQELNGKTLKAALNSIKDFDTGGLIGVPISIPGNSVPVGRIYSYSAADKQMKPASDWISVGA